MRKIVQEGIGQWFTKHRHWAVASIICPSLAYVGSGYERLNYWVDYLRSIRPEASETEIILLAASYMRGDLGTLIFAVKIASIFGLGLAAVSVYLERRLTVAGLLGVLVNGFPFLFFGYWLFAYQLLKSLVVT